MDKFVQSLGVTDRSKSQVSEMAKDLDEQVEAFRTRPLADAGPFTFVAADVLVLKVREGLAANDYRDPGWYSHPPGTVAREWTGETPAAPAATNAAPAATPADVQVRKPAGHRHH